jgi:small neutral amino acid transporter SnatA (MarC family)
VSSIFQVKFCWEVFVALLMITDPPGIVPVFLGTARGHPRTPPARLAGLTSSADRA